MKEDYPRNLVELEARFSTEEACREYLLKLRWPEGFVCPRCGIQSSWASKRNLLLCADCGYQASVTAGTIFQDTRKPLTLWFRAAWWVTTQKGGASALELQRVLGLGSYVTAWTWLHKFRRAMVRPGRNRLVGRVEVDETYVGGVEEGVRGREMVGKALVAVAAEEDGRGMGRIRLRRIVDASAASLEAFVEEAIVYNRKSVIPKGFCGLKTGWWRAEHAVRTMCSTLPTGMYTVIYPVVGGGVDTESGFRHSSLRSPQRGSPHLRRAPGASRVLHALGLMIISWMRGCVLRCVLQRVVGITCCSRTPRSVLRSMAILALV